MYTKHPLCQWFSFHLLDSCDSESDSLTVKLAFDLSYIGRQFYSLFLNHEQGLVMKNEEIDNLRKQLTQASNEIKDLKNRETKTKHQFHQLYSQLSLDQQDFGRDESTVSTYDLYCTLVTICSCRYPNLYSNREVNHFLMKNLSTTILLIKH